MEKILISDSGQEKQKEGEGGRKGEWGETKKGKETPLVVCGMKTNVSKATFST